jgi:hypothetical protein
MDDHVNLLDVELVVVLPVEEHLVLSGHSLRQRQSNQPHVAVAAELERALEPIGFGAHDQMLAAGGVRQTLAEIELRPSRSENKLVSIARNQTYESVVTEIDWINFNLRVLF